MPFTKQHGLDETILRLSHIPLAEQELDQLGELFEEVGDLTFVFIARSDTSACRVNKYGPDCLDVLELVSCVNQGREYHPRFPNEADTCENDKCDASYRRQIQHEVETRVKELHSRPNTFFILFWNIAGSLETHLATSVDMCWDDARHSLTSLLSELMLDYIE